MKFDVGVYGSMKISQYVPVLVKFGHNIRNFTCVVIFWSIKMFEQ
jgi:hypothetical protein